MAVFQKRTNILEFEAMSLKKLTYKATEPMPTNALMNWKRLEINMDLTLAGSLNLIEGEQMVFVGNQDA